jgi:hypothetical protein
MKVSGHLINDIDSMREILPVQGRIQEILTRCYMVKWLLIEIGIVKSQGW